MLAGCAPTVQLETPRPLKVDINMTIDVHQKKDADSTKLSTLSDEEEAKAVQRREQRAGEIWTLKNDGAAIEGRQGYLEAQSRSGWDPEHVRRMVEEENKDRHLLYEREAHESARPLAAIETEAGQRLRQQAYDGKKD